MYHFKGLLFHNKIFKEIVTFCKIFSKIIFDAK